MGIFLTLELTGSVNFNAEQVKDVIYLFIGFLISIIGFAEIAKTKK